MKYLFCGDRNWTDEAKIEAVIKTLSNDDLVIEGGARGADSIAGRMAAKYGIPVAQFPANWGHYGKSAGPIRNGWMLKFGLPDKVIAFHSDIDHSKGTGDMVKRARAANIPVEIIA
jgi:hypothetical protein